MHNILYPKEVKSLLSLAGNPKKFRGSHEEVVPLCGKQMVFPEASAILNRRGIKFSEKTEMGIYQFRNVGMHTDGMSPQNYGGLIMVLKGGGNLNYFKNKKNLTALNVGQVWLEPCSVFFLDDKLPHSFILTKGDFCVSLIVDLPKKSVPDHFK